MENKRLETIEDLIEMALRPYGKDKRWELDKHENQEYDDKLLGEAWEKDGDIIRAKKNYYGTPEWIEHERKKPPTHMEPIYYLYYRSNAWHEERWDLSIRLGEQIDTVWTRKEKYGRQCRIGLLTLAGILKRLGRTDVGEKIKEATKKRNEESAKSNRNFHRRNIAEAMLKFSQATTRAKEDNINFPTIDFSSIEPYLKLED